MSEIISYETYIPNNEDKYKSIKRVIYTGDVVNSIYREVPYLESNGTQFINTNLYANGQDVIEIKGQFVKNVGTQELCGSHLSGYYYRVACVFNNYFKFSAGYWNEYNNDSQGKPVAPFDLNTHIFKLDVPNRKGYVDNTMVQLSTGNNNYPGQGTKPLLLFARAQGPNASTWGATGKCHFRMEYAKFYQSGNLVRDLVPMVRIADEKPGLYDKVNNVFYVNQGTGDDFSVLPSEIVSYKTYINN